MLKAQPVNNLIKDVTMPAPNAASLGKYGDYSVGNFTGVPDISIPIYTVQEGSLSLPISLSYHASGIKVAEMASWVGAGWSLSAGGIISRTIQGVRDEDFARGYYNNGQNLTNLINSGTTYVDVNIANGQVDGEPDIFNFNVGGYSGKFYIDYKNAVSQGKAAYQFVPKQDLKLEFDDNFLGFTIIAPNGTRYIFGRYQPVSGPAITAHEKTLYQNQSSGERYISSWYLLRIESPDKLFNISLNYQDEAYSYLNNASGKFIRAEALVNSCASSVEEYIYSSSSNTEIDVNHRHFRTYIDGKRLTQITTGTNTSTVNFAVSTNRADLDDNKGFTEINSPMSKYLDKIEIITGDKCKKFDMAYDYFQDPGSTTKSCYKRLRLLSVTEKSCDGSIVNPPYTFTYNGNYLPHRLSKAVDHWGYSNGAVDNETKAINVPPTTIIVGTGSTSTFGASNRETNETEMKKSVLTQIQYPTGGKTDFSFEANTVPFNTQSDPVQVFSLANCSNPTNPACCGYTSAYSSYTFTSEDISTGKFTLQVTAIPNFSYTCSGYTNYNPSGYIYIYDANWNYIGSYGLGLNNGEPYSTVPPQSLSTLANFQVNTTYNFQIAATNSYTTFKITNQPYIAITRKVGGLRIKEIKSHDGVALANDVLKTYDYSDINNSNISSGKLIRFPTYGLTLPYSYIYDITSPGTGSAGYATIISFNDESIVPLYSLEGNHIGYQYVKETYSGNGYNSGNGYKQYKYFVDSYVPINPFPTPPADPKPSNGQLNYAQVYSQQANISQATTNSFVNEGYTVNSGSIRKIAQFALNCSGATYPDNNTTLFAILHTDYNLKTLPYRLESTTQMIDGVSTTTNFTYNTDGNLPTLPLNMPLTTSMTNSDGKTTVTTNKYITHTDYNADPVATKLKQLNIIADPVEAITTVAGVQINGARTQYSFFDNTTGLSTTSATNSFPYPNQFYKYKMTWDANGNAQVFGTNSGWELEGTITKFDMTRGKPLSINLRAWENATETNATEKYTWETNGLIKNRTFKGFVWQYEYFPNTKLVSKIIDKDGQFVTYTYDHLQRLKTASARNGAVSTNYTYTYKDPTQFGKSWIETKTTFTSVIGGTLSNNTTYKTMRQYMDGLGRPIQSVAVANSPNMKDVISTVAYDNQGRESLKYDPFESTQTTGSFINTVPAGHPFTKVEYEASPLSRTSIVTPPGWLPTTTTYGTNAQGEAYDNTGAAYFPANTLNRTITTDPDGRVMKIYTDKKGRKVFTVKVQNNAAGGHYMIYSFDDKDRLNKVYTPRNTWQEWFYAPNLDYSYRYDVNDNMIWKQLPDIAAINIQYNARNQMVLMQDGKQASASQWLATQYDDYGRPSATGFATSTALNATTFNPTLSSTLTTTDYSTVAGTELGKPIRTKNYLGTYLESFMQYDAYGRLSNAFSNNQLYSPSGAITATNFSEKITMGYDLADNILTKTRTHKPNASTTRTIVETNDYDNGLRLKQMKHQLDAMPVEILSYNDYNVKNQLQTKWMGKAGSLNFLQKVDYNYNSLGWLTGINQNLANGGLDRPLANCYYPANVATSTTDLDINDLFLLELKYENPNAALAPSGTSVTPQYGGNISQVVWKVKGREKQAYTLKYDSENRMTEAIYSDIGNSGTITGNRYDEKLTYDIRGNINTLQRWGLNGSCQYHECE